MQRSRSQTLYRHLPESVYTHDDQLLVRSFAIGGPRLGPVINQTALLAEVDRALRQWPDDKRVGIQLPSRTADSDFVAIEPRRVEWDVWPLVFHCGDSRCARVTRFYRGSDVLAALNETGRLRCKHCNSRVRQIPYFSAHACGRISQMFVPQCRSCESDEHVYIDDTGSFETASWRCRRCGNAYIQGTRMAPCNCGQYMAPGKSQPFMRMFTVRDPRAFYPQTVSLLNLKSRSFDLLQTHPSRGLVAIGSYLGHETQVASALDEVEGPGKGRMTEEEWAEALNSRYQHLDPYEIELLRKRRGPATEGVAAVGEIAAEAVALGEKRLLIERATLFDRQQVRRYLLDDALEEAKSMRFASEPALHFAAERAASLGIAELSVTVEFPIAVAAYGYTRVTREPGTSTLRSFARAQHYDGRTPIFVVPTDTEAVLVTLSAQKVLAWLATRGSYAGEVPSAEADARKELINLFALDDDSVAAAEARTLVHTLSHALLRALDDGKSGFGESSLAEWVVPETLTFGIYVSSFQSHTLGAFWTLLHSRAGEWLESAFESVWSCGNDPLCHQRSPMACVRCLFLTFGCSSFNSDLSRSLVMDFWRAGDLKRRDA